MFNSDNSNSSNYDEIMLSFKEKQVLYRILRKKIVPDTFCNEIQKDIFLKYGLICIKQNSIVTSTGKVVPDDNSPKFILPTDKALRYFLYRKDAYFKGKLPVVIALAALIISIANFLYSWML